jgi:hypothetical protein
MFERDFESHVYSPSQCLWPSAGARRRESARTMSVNQLGRLRDRRTSQWVGFILTLLTTGTACSSDETELFVEICGDLSVPTELDSLRVAILDEQRRSVRSGVRELLQCPGDRISALPQSVSFPLLEGEGWIVVTGLRDEVEIIRFERRIHVEGQESNPIVAYLDRQCLGFQCPLGQTCLQGRCQLTPVATSRDQCPRLEAGPMEDDVGLVIANDAGEVVEPPRYCPQPESGSEAQ